MMLLEIQEHVPDRQASEEFLRMMIRRVVVGHAKYGPISKHHLEYDLLANVRTRMREYEKTGNTEFLVDAANFLMFEFMFPSHEKGHFRGTDAHESPGVVYAGSTRPLQKAEFA